MKAKEMFEKLDFKQVCNDNNFIVYEKIHIIGYHQWQIRFLNKEVVFDNRGNSNEPYFVLDVNLLKAITQQMKELGWIE